MLLDIEPFPARERPLKEREFSHWGKVAKAIYNTTDEESVLRVLQLELMSRKRRMIINRVYSRFSRLRADRERRNVDAFLMGAANNVIETPPWACWATLSALVDAEDLEGIRSMMLHERANKNRNHVLKRMYGKLMAKRMQQERKEMLTWRLKEAEHVPSI